MHHVRLDATPLADPAAIVSRGVARFTVLAPDLVRCELGAQREERATQQVWYRQHPVPAFTVRDDAGDLVIRTDAIELRWRLGTATLAGNLRVTRLSDGVTWTQGSDVQALPGPARTLDQCDGNFNMENGCQLPRHPGLVTRSGFAWIDDRSSLAFDDDGFACARAGDAEDGYVCAAGTDHAATLRRYYQITGLPPLVPRWALGVWWSRWQAYSQADLTGIVQQFADHGVVLSALVIDMDWHITTNAYTSGWTGYTWNRTLFPDPEGFFRDLHARGIHACLNLHPRDGVHPHEDAYPAMARHMGIDPDSKIPVRFAITDRRFIEGYFTHLHHPLERQGVDFWWIDWQQEPTTDLPGLDPLWYLNHLHSRDRARDGTRRPFTFSRWGGVASHRYPMGFAGDTYRTWNSLAFGVRYAASLSNVGYGWFSTDIGGFARGPHDSQLYARWVQAGCFSPILRMHNCGDPTLDYRPWTHEGEPGRVALDALRLRARLVPYMYTQARRHAEGGLPLLRSMELQQPSDAEAWCWPYQYWFGDALVVAPVTTAADPDTGHARVAFWLPEGSWCDLCTGRRLAGGRPHVRHCRLHEIPVYARAGAVVPMAEGAGYELLALPGDGGGELYEDDGDNLDWQKPAGYARWTITQTWDGTTLRLAVRRSDGSRASTAPVRLRLRGYDVAAWDGEGWRRDGADWVRDLGTLAGDLELTATVRERAVPVVESPRARFTRICSAWGASSHDVRPLVDQSEAIVADPAGTLPTYVCTMTIAQVRQIVEELYDVGCTIVRQEDGTVRAVWWNRSGRSDYLVRFTTQDAWRWKRFECGSEGSAHFKPHEFHNDWLLRVDLMGLGEWREQGRDWKAVEERR